MKDLFTTTEIAEALGKCNMAVWKRAKKEGWHFKKKKHPGGFVLEYPLSSLPPDIQQVLITTMDHVPDELLPVLAPAAAIEAIKRNGGPPGRLTDVRSSRAIWTPERAVGPKDLENEQLMRRALIVQEAQTVPRDWKGGKRKWIESVAARHGVGWQTIYKWIKKYGDAGLAGLRHTKSTAGTPTSWDEEALEWWIGLVLKHRDKISRKHLYYQVLVVEARRRGWRIGGERSAVQYARDRITPQLLALAKGGPRGLDNMLPPVLRNYSDLRPFQIIVGDQHRFDFWVRDDVTGEVFRPEGYFWQDLRTRAWYGGAIDKRYDSHLMGLALHIGCRAFGPFECLYTDNGKPEQSKYIMSIARDIRRLSFETARTADDIPGDLAGMDDEEDMPLVRIGQRFAIPKNAKAKMIEGSFKVLEQLLRDVIRMPGYVKKLGGDPEENDIDQKEIERLARSGKLLTFSEFRMAVYRTLDYYNRTRPHRGARREWCFGARPKEVRPMDVLMSCYQEGWRPRGVSPEALALVFLKRERRKVRKGRIELCEDFWEARGLLPWEGQWVEVRYDPMALTELIVFDEAGRFICLAQPVEYSSMIDRDKVSRLIRRKRQLRREVQDEYKRLTAGIPDVRKFSETPVEEKAAALIARERRRVAEKNEVRYRERTEAELAAEIAQIEDYRPERRRPVTDDKTRIYEWILGELADGRELSPEDVLFKGTFEAGLSDEAREHWAIYAESIGLRAAMGGD